MPKKVLLVDDEPRILTLLHSVLQSDGLEAVSAKDGPAAIALLKTQKFDLMISDIRKPLWMQPNCRSKRHYTRNSTRATRRCTHTRTLE